jgi:hypothetical protein
MTGPLVRTILRGRAGSPNVDADFTEDLIYNKAAIKGGVLYGCYCNQED